MSNANQTAISFCRETAFNTQLPVLTAEGVAGTNTLHALRFTKDGLVAEKETLTSEEIKSNRMVAELIRVGLKNSGNIEAEFSMKDYDDLIESALQSDYGTTIAVTVNIVAAAGTITATSGTPFKAIKNAKHVKIASAVDAGNNGIKTVVSMTDTVITVGAGQLSDNETGDAITVSVTFVAEYYSNASCDITGNNTITLGSGTFSAAIKAARYVKLGGNVTVASVSATPIVKVVSCSDTEMVISGATLDNDITTTVTFDVNYIRTGSTYQTYLLQKEFTDISRYLAFTGMGVDTYDFRMESKAKVAQAFAFFGCQGLSRSAKVNTVAAIAASTNGIVNTSSMIGSLLKDGAAFGNAVMSASFQVKNNLRERPSIGSLVSQEHGVGFSEITGELRVYFTSAEMLTAFLNHSTFSVEFPAIDAAGNVMNVYLPAVQTASGSPDNTGVNTDIMQNVQFRAVPHPTLGYQIQIDRLLA